MDPVRCFIKSRMAVFAEQSAFVESEFQPPVVDGDMADCLLCARILDDTVDRTTVGAKPLLWLWHFEQKMVIVPVCFNTFDGYFLWQFCQVIACFHSCFSYLLCIIFYVAIREYHRVAKMAIRASNMADKIQDGMCGIK